MKKYTHRAYFKYKRFFSKLYFTFSSVCALDLIQVCFSEAYTDQKRPICKMTFVQRSRPILRLVTIEFVQTKIPSK